MANTQERDLQLADRVTFWRTVHDAATVFYEGRDQYDAEALRLPEIQTHDAVCVMHALAHGHLAALGVESYPDCPAGDGSDVLPRMGFLVEVVAFDE